MVELLAPVLALETLKAYLKDQLVLLVVAEAVDRALIKRYSPRSDVCELVGVFWDLVLDCKAWVVIDRVPNCSDPPSRDKLKIGEALRAKML